jgi:hypothetical protein
VGGTNNRQVVFSERSGKMIISLGNLRAGIRWWHKGDWPKDIHNADYCNIYDFRTGGVTVEWWSKTMDRLSKWRAYRGPNPPNTKEEITARGLDRLDNIAAQYVRLLASSPEEPTIADRRWEDVKLLFSLATEIKGGSPVFAGKLCHFLFPKLFIVMDNLATSIFDYEFYWRGMKDEWCRFNEKAEAKNLLIEAIKSDLPIHRLYPIETKVMELSHIGYKHGGNIE